jgi:hypothetical protein
MRHFKRTVLITSVASLLVAPALADDGDKTQTRERTQVTAEQRQQAMEERRQAVHSLPAEQRAAVREAHRKARANEGAELQKRIEKREHRHDRSAAGARGAGKGHGSKRGR